MAAVNLTNWRESPHNIWAFQNVDKVLSTQVIEKGSKHHILETQSRSFDDFKLQLGESPALDLAGYQKFVATDGMVILHKGKIVHEFYGNGNDATSKHIMMSMTKSVTGLVTGILSSRGKMDLAKPIKHYVPEASFVYDGVTVQHCLDMNCGIKHQDENHNYRAAGGWEPIHGDEPAKTLHGYLAQMEALSDGPGVGFNYASTNTDLLGWALERATGKKLAELISELLWQPMGAESDAIIAVDSEGSARAAGGMCATVRDIARVGQLVADGGRGVVPTSWIDDMTHNGNKDNLANSSWAPMFHPEFDNAAYRDCWVADSKMNVLFGVGVFGQWMMVDPENKIVMALTASQPEARNDVKLKMAPLAFMEIRRILTS